MATFPKLQVCLGWLLDKLRIIEHHCISRLCFVWNIYRQFQPEELGKNWKCMSFKITLVSHIILSLVCLRDCNSVSFLKQFKKHDWRYKWYIWVAGVPRHQWRGPRSLDKLRQWQEPVQGPSSEILLESTLWCGVSLGSGVSRPKRHLFPR